MKLHEIAAALRTELSEHFRTVRLSSMQTQEQFLRELKSINPEKLPGVVIVFDGLTMISENGSQEMRFTLVAVDRFTAGSDERALSVFATGARLLDLFPADGKTIGDMFCHPEDCLAASPDGGFAMLAVGIVCKQGF